jgi:hypothetical protein
LTRCGLTARKDDAPQQRGAPNGLYGILGHCSDHSGVIPANYHLTPLLGFVGATTTANAEN